MVTKLRSTLRACTSWQHQLQNGMAKINPYESPQPDVGDESHPREPNLLPLWFVGGVFFGMIGGALSCLLFAGNPILVAMATMFSAVTGAAFLSRHDRPNQKE